MYGFAVCTRNEKLHNFHHNHNVCVEALILSWLDFNELLSLELHLKLIAFKQIIVTCVETLLAAYDRSHTNIWFENHNWHYTLMSQLIGFVNYLLNTSFSSSFLFALCKLLRQNIFCQIIADLAASFAFWLDSFFRKWLFSIFNWMCL